MILVAHRGCAARYPENTIHAVRQCSPHVDRIEIDVRRCATGELVVIRDESFERVAGVDKQVRETPLDEIRTLNVLGSGESPPLLSELVDGTPPDVGLHVDLKEPGLAQDVLEVLSNAENDSLLITMEPELLADIPDTDVDLGYVFHDEPFSNLKLADELGCVSIEAHHSICTPTLVERAHDRGLEVIAGGGITNYESYDEMRSVKADGAMVDHHDFE